VGPPAVHDRSVRRHVAWRDCLQSVHADERSVQRRVHVLLPEAPGAGQPVAHDYSHAVSNPLPGSHRDAVFDPNAHPGSHGYAAGHDEPVLNEFSDLNFKPGSHSLSSCICQPYAVEFASNNSVANSFVVCDSQFYSNKNPSEHGIADADEIANSVSVSFWVTLINRDPEFDSDRLTSIDAVSVPNI
jgi:hypothetical protein